MGHASRERAGSESDGDGDSGDPLVERPAQVRGAAEARRSLLHDRPGAGGFDLRVPRDPQPLAYRRCRALPGTQGQPDRTGRRLELDQDRLLLLDLYRLDGNAPTSGKTFWDCYTSYQGVSVGWVDQYHQSTDGQQVDLTGVPNPSDYYLVSTTNPTGVFLEQDKTNNTEWVKFTLSSDSNGNRKVTATDHSPCEDPGMCGERSTNR